ncbi:MAG TPA: hypothetical protein ENK85_09310 [Saprospiraceae bacterium]|nr:hypothetical protein [Saprospiraceae bacterium]
MGFFQNIKDSPKYVRWTQWEYWPMAAFYIPVFPYYLYLSVRAGHPFFYVAANPSIKSGGSGFESKYDTIKMLPQKWAPKTILAPKGSDFKVIQNALRQKEIDFPVIAKPDIGFRGLLVEKVNNPAQLKAHIQKYQIDFIIQEFIESPIEFSIFYHRIPGEDQGNITSLTVKEFLQINGDGKTNFGDLLHKSPRAKVILKDLQLRYKNLWHSIPVKGKKIKVMEIGNHCRGAHFINGNHLIDKQLHKVFDELNHKIPGWNYGRVDVRCDSIEALKKGDFKIIEINGVLSEPTHIYDATKTTYWKALREIAKHWKILYLVATKNHKKYGIEYDNPVEYIRSVKKLRQYVKGLENN